MVDTWVVGNFVSNEAFSAVGTVGPIINMLIGFFMGLSSGAGVVISQYYGAHRPEKVRDTVHTAMVLTLVLCAAFTALGLALIPAMLDLMNTPAEVLPESTAYLSIYFSGITGLLIYNMGSGILRAVGDSRRQRRRAQRPEEYHPAPGHRPIPPHQGGRRLPPARGARHGGLGHGQARG